MADDLYSPERLKRMRELGLLNGDPIPGEPLPNQPVPATQGDLSLTTPPAYNPDTGTWQSYYSGIEREKDVSAEKVGDALGGSSADYYKKYVGPSEALAADLEDYEAKAAVHTGLALPDKNVKESGDPNTQQKKDAFSLFSDPDLKSAFDQQKAGLEHAAMAKQMAAQGEMRLLDGLAEKQAELQEKNQLREIARQKQVQDRMGQLDKAVGAFSNAKVDPKRMWSSMSNGEKAVMSIGLALGALGAAHAGPNGKNHALGIFMKAVDDDIQLQKEEIARLGDTVTQKRNLMQDMRTMFSDERQAETAAKLALVNQYELQLKSNASRYKSPEIQGNLQMQLGALDVERQKLLAEFQQNEMLAATKAAGKIGGLSTDQYLSRYIPNYGIALGTMGDVSDFRKAVGSNLTANDQIDQLIEMVGQGGRLDGAQKKRANAIVSNLKGSLRVQVLGPGAVTEYEQAILSGLIPNPTEMLSIDSWNLEGLQSLKNILNRGLEVQAGIHGVHKAETEGEFDSKDARFE